MSLPKVSVVIAAYNEEGNIKFCLDSLLKQNYPVDSIEIIVVDDGSEDGTRDVASMYPVKLLMTEHRGPSHARNQGIKHASGELIAFTDADCIADENWLKELAKHFDDEQVGGVGGRRRILNPKSWVSSWIKLENDDRFDRMPFYTNWIGTDSCVYRKDALRKAGFFLEDVFSFSSAEDNDLAYRVVEKGLKLVYEPKAVIHYNCPESLFEYLRHQFKKAIWFVPLYFLHPKKFVTDKFVRIESNLQPLVLGVLFLVLPAIDIRFIPVIFLAALLMNLPLALRIYRRSKRVFDIAKTLIIASLRSLAWTAGMILGFVKLVSLWKRGVINKYRKFTRYNSGV